jgi:hypothetical protein
MTIKIRPAMMASEGKEGRNKELLKKFQVPRTWLHKFPGIFTDPMERLIWKKDPKTYLQLKVLLLEI